MTRKPTTSEQRKRRVEEVDEKRKADEIAGDKAVHRMIQQSIKKHGP